jgi:hypothetical protein
MKQGVAKSLTHSGRAVMAEASKFIASWPVSFINALTNNKVRYSDLADPRDTLPFWIEKCVHSLKQRQRADWNIEEIGEVARVIVARHGHLDGATARSEYGVYLPWDRLPSIFRSTVSEEAHETLMATLDQSVSATFDPKKRFAFLQDKVMFCLFRFTEMTTVAIHELKVTELASFTAKPTKLRLGHAACSREEAFRGLQRHVKCERAKLTESADCTYVFFSPFTGRALSDSGIQMRFQNAVRQAFLTAAVPNMKAYKVGSEPTISDKTVCTTRWV